MEQAFFSVPLSRLEPTIKRWFREVQTELQENKQSSLNQNSEDVLTRKQTLGFLGISSPTLWRWEKQGKIKGYGTGGKRFYKRSELLDSLVLLKN